MFQKLCPPLIQKIFEYDPTYKDVFKNVLRSIVTPRMKVVHKLLAKDHALEAERRFEKMGEVDVDIGTGIPFVEIQYDHTTRMAFYVMDMTERYLLDLPHAKDSILIVKDYLHHVPLSTLSLFASCSADTLWTLLEEYMTGESDDPSVYNHCVYDVLGEGGYGRLIHHLMDMGVYHSFVHRYVFGKLFGRIGETYSMEDSENHRFIQYEDQNYTVYWNVYTNSLLAE